MRSGILQVPGKLLLLGEYGVLEPGTSALVIAINRYVSITIEPASAFSISTDFPSTRTYPFNYAKGYIDMEAGLPFVQSALEHGLNYLGEAVPFSIQIASKLHQDHKLGLGSSAAITVGIIAAILHFQGIDITLPAIKMRIFKLAAMAHWKVQQGGSGIDIAASTFGGVLHYYRFQPQWSSLQSIRESVNKSWPHLSIEPLRWPETFFLAVGWTQQHAHTPSYIQTFTKFKYEYPGLHQQFVFASNQIVLQARQAIETSDYPLMVQSFQASRTLLNELGRQLTLVLETPLLQQLADVAEQAGAIGKLSGAGGGDCGVAITPSSLIKEIIEKGWVQSQIQPIPLEISFDGVSLVG